MPQAKRKNTTRAATKRPDIIDPADLPDQFGMTIRGDCMWPAMADGDRLYFDKTEEPKVGDLIIMFKRPELVREGEPQASVKRLVTGIPPWVKYPYQDHPDSKVQAIIIVEMDNPRKQFVVECDKLCAIYKSVHHVVVAADDKKAAAS